MFIQGYYSDGSVCLETEMGLNDTIESAIRVAKEYKSSKFFEGDAVRLITEDGELIWDSEAN